MLINGFLAYLPNDRGMAGPRVEDSGFARVRRWAEEEGRPVYAPGEAGNGFVLSVRGQGANGLTHTFFDSDGGRSVGREETAGRILLHVVPGAAASPAARETEALPPTVDAWEAWAERRVDIFNLIEAGPGHFRVLSDVLSLLPYWVGELADGVVVSSSIKDLLSVFPELARPHDPIGITHFLFGGKGTRTVHARIRASAPGTTLRWAEREGVTALRDRRLGPVPLDPDLGTGKAVQEAVDLLGDKIASFV
ncbi:MAG: hypothetical protein KJN92_05765, partial [Gemmatimonadetes bacterium]|nr:hypothetical protein [Gemmatimonadota bacterium]